MNLQIVNQINATLQTHRSEIFPRINDPKTYPTIYMESASLFNKRLSHTKSNWCLKVLSKYTILLNDIKSFNRFFSLQPPCIIQAKTSLMLQSLKLMRKVLLAVRTRHRPKREWDTLAYKNILRLTPYSQAIGLQKLARRLCLNKPF